MSGLRARPYALGGRCRKIMTVEVRGGSTAMTNQWILGGRNKLLEGSPAQSFERAGFTLGRKLLLLAMPFP